MQLNALLKLKALLMSMTSSKMNSFLFFCCKFAYGTGHAFKNILPISDADSFPGSVPGPVPAACEGRWESIAQERLLSKLVFGELLGCPHECLLLPQPHLTAGSAAAK